MTNATTTKTTPPTAKQATCKEEGCERKILARKMCSSHYSQWHRTEGGKERTYTCTGCGSEYTTRRKPRGDARFCSAPCQLSWMSTDEAVKARQAEGFLEYVENLPPDIRACAECGTGYDYRIRVSEYCSLECSSEGMRRKSRGRRSDLRKAYEANDYKGIREAIEKRAKATKTGCWEWKQLDRTGYPRMIIEGKHIAVHRLSLEAKYEAPLGGQAAHHMCANTKCVNPEHLQPITHRENMAEMLSRRAYVDRIAELEEVIKGLAPNHEVLNRVPIK